MLKRIITILFAIFYVVGAIYLALPNYTFPDPPPDSIQSQEPADLESPLRRGYFTNFTREEALLWYGEQFNHSTFMEMSLPTLLLNYPPENAQTLIRDQTSSTFLQEFVHPFRESEYINGFEPAKKGDSPAFTVEDKSWTLKIIVRQVPSNLWVREVIFLLSCGAMIVLYKAFEKSFRIKNV